jgi:hypothetical protein
LTSAGFFLHDIKEPRKSDERAIELVTKKSLRETFIINPPFIYNLCLGKMKDNFINFNHKNKKKYSIFSLDFGSGEKMDVI